MTLTPPHLFKLRFSESSGLPCLKVCSMCAPTLNGKEYQMFWLAAICIVISALALYAIIISAFEIGEGR